MVILTAGPCYDNDDKQEVMLQCYQRCLQLVSTHSITSIVSELVSYNNINKINVVVLGLYTVFPLIGILLHCNRIIR